MTKLTPQSIAENIVNSSEMLGDVGTQELIGRIAEAIAQERAQLIVWPEFENKNDFDKWATKHSTPYPSRESFFYGCHQSYCRFLEWYNGLKSAVKTSPRVVNMDIIDELASNEAKETIMGVEQINTDIYKGFLRGFEKACGMLGAVVEGENK